MEAAEPPRGAAGTALDAARSTPGCCSARDGSRALLHAAPVPETAKPGFHSLRANPSQRPLKSRLRNRLGLLAPRAGGVAAGPQGTQSPEWLQGNKTVLQMTTNLSNLSHCCSPHCKILLSLWIAESNKDARVQTLCMRAPVPAERLQGLTSASSPCVLAVLARDGVWDPKQHPDTK